MARSDDATDFWHTRFASPRAALDRPICRLGLASRGNTGLRAEDVHQAIGRGVNFLNWCGQPDGLSQAIAELGRRREEVAVCVQLEARTAREAQEELPGLLRALGTDHVEVVTFYYVEHAAEWDEIRGPGGAMQYCAAAQRDGQVRMLGVTSHQRPLAAQMAQSGLLDMLMIRYNAAHRGAESDVFPHTTALGLPVVVYTCLRWGALLEPTPEDPAGFAVPRAPAWYRFALQHPAVSVALMAPDSAAELNEDLQVLAASGPLSEAEYQRLVEHGLRVRKHSGSFP